MENLFTKFTTLFLLVVWLPCSAFAQNDGQSKRTETIITQKDNAERMASINAVPELQSQLVKKFGEKFSLENNEVRAQLRTNFENETASSAIRRTSLFAYYGEEYKKHINLISTRK